MSTTDANISGVRIRIRRPAAQAPVTTLAVNKVHCGDALVLAPQVGTGTAQIIVADPPWTQEIAWHDKWLADSLRIIRDDGTMFIIGPSEKLAHLMVRLPDSCNCRWLVWHFINKNTINTNFWQHSHESILVVWKKTKVFHADAIREPYCDNYIKYSAGRVRKGTHGFFDNSKETMYKAHERGALPRDVLKVPALAGGAARKERVAHPEQRPLALMRRLLESCQQSEGIVFVPFAGSGTACVAAAIMHLPFIGIEIESGYVRMSEIRLALPTTEDEEAVANTIVHPDVE